MTRLGMIFHNALGVERDPAQAVLWWRRGAERGDADGQAANVIWAMQDRNTWDEVRRLQTRHAGHAGYGHYHEHYVKCADGKWRIKVLKLSYLHMDFY